MYNLYLHEQEQNKLNEQLKRNYSYDKIAMVRKYSNKQMSEKYKQRVRNFLVDVVSKPIVLGQYQPPITNIVRNPENEKILANAQLYISGFKTNKERIANAVEENKVYDLSSPLKSSLLHQFRVKNHDAEIQPNMRFKSNYSPPNQIKKQLSLPRLKMQFKGLQQLGNGLKSMNQSQLDKNGLINRLQTVSGGKQYDHITFTMLALRQSKLLATKHKQIK